MICSDLNRFDPLIKQYAISVVNVETLHIKRARLLGFAFHYTGFNWPAEINV